MGLRFLQDPLAAGDRLRVPGAGAGSPVSQLLLWAREGVMTAGWSQAGGR